MFGAQGKEGSGIHVPLTTLLVMLHGQDTVSPIAVSCPTNGQLEDLTSGWN